MKSAQVTHWQKEEPPTQAELLKIMTGEGMSPYTWANGPYDTYSAHSHGYDKVIYVVQGSIVFGLPELGEKIELSAGDRLDLPAGVIHDAKVGAQGVTCLEGHM